MNVSTALRNVMQVLQQRPSDYRKFGASWWLVKAALKRAGYSQDELYLLGDYFPNDVADLVRADTLEAGLREAFREYGQAHFSGGLVSLTPDGDRYLVVDPDAGGL